MDLKKAEVLIEKYYNGETSPEEELQLREFFRTAENIPEHLMPEKELFSLYLKAADEEVPIHGYIKNLERVIDSRSVTSPGTRKSIIYRISGIAAGIALLLTSYFLLVNKPFTDDRRQALKDTYENPQLAYEETQKVLLYISQKMNKGTAPLSNVSKLNKPVQNIQNLKKLKTGMNQLQMLNLLNNSEKKNTIK